MLYPSYCWKMIFSSLLVGLFFTSTPVLGLSWISPLYLEASENSDVTSQWNDLDSATNCSRTPRPTIAVKQGTIRGIRQISSGFCYEEFLGIPYGAPPIGKLRFKFSEAAGNWTGILDASHRRKLCPQRYDQSTHTDEAEDCLHLNIIVPRGVQSVQSLPVMVYLPGGGYESSESPDLTYFSCRSDIIVVTISFRVGVLGFYSNKQTQSKGNYGLSDQRLAVEWVYENIKQFRGDPSRISLLGHGSGVTAAMIIAMKSSIITRVLALSGSASSGWEFDYTVSTSVTTSEKTSIYIARRLNCVGNGIMELECLRSKTISNLIEAAKMQEGGKLKWLPTRDGDLIEYTPMENLNRAALQNVSLFIGNTQFEVANLAEQIVPQFTNASDPTTIDVERFLGHLPYEMDYIGYRPPEGFTRNLIKHEYFGDTSTRALDVTRRLTELLTDKAFVSATMSTLNTHLEHGGKAILYNFQHSVDAENKNRLVKGSRYYDDIYFLIGLPFTQSAEFSEEDRNVSETWMNLVASFVRDGDFPREFPGAWYDLDNEFYNIISATPTVGFKLKRAQSYFWNTLVPYVPGQMPTTQQPFTTASTTVAQNTDADRGVLGLDVQKVELMFLITTSILFVLLLLSLTYIFCKLRRS